MPQISQGYTQQSALWHCLRPPTQASHPEDLRPAQLMRLEIKEVMRVPGPRLCYHLVQRMLAASLHYPPSWGLPLSSHLPAKASFTHSLSRSLFLFFFFFSFFRGWGSGPPTAQRPSPRSLSLSLTLTHSLSHGLCRFENCKLGRP